MGFFVFTMIDGMRIFQNDVIDPCEPWTLKR